MRGLVISLCTCIFRKYERPQKKLHGEGTDSYSDTRTSWLLERIGLRADSLKSPRLTCFTTGHPRKNHRNRMGEGGGCNLEEMEAQGIKVGWHKRLKLSRNIPLFQDFRIKFIYLFIKVQQRISLNQEGIWEPGSLSQRGRRHQCQNDPSFLLPPPSPAFAPPCLWPSSLCPSPHKSPRSRIQRSIRPGSKDLGPAGIEYTWDCFEVCI